MGPFVRSSVAAVAIPFVFVVSWFICQWILWLFFAFSDLAPEVTRGGGLKPYEVNALDQLYRDLIPAGLGMASAAWVAKNKLGASYATYWSGTAIVLVLLTGMAGYFTWIVFAYGFPSGFLALTRQWLTPLTVALVAKLAAPKRSAI